MNMHVNGATAPLDKAGRPAERLIDAAIANLLAQVRACSGHEDPEERCPRKNPSETCICWKWRNLLRKEAPR